MGGRAQHGKPGSDRYHTFLSLSGDGVARFELDPPLVATAPEERQVTHILRHGRVAECNELFAGFYGRRAPAEMFGLAMGDFVPESDPARLKGIREFVRARYRLVYVEEEHARPGAPSRWISASALGATKAGRLHEFWVCLREITERKQAELDRERRGRILEAVAFSAARLLRPGGWRAQVDGVLARLGEAAQVARSWIAEIGMEKDGSDRLDFRFSWGVPGEEMRLDDPRIAKGLSVPQAGFEVFLAELRGARPVVRVVRELPEVTQRVLRQMGSKAFAVVPIFANERLWGLLAFGETRFDRQWSAPEIEALKAGAAVIGAAIERERADAALLESEERFERLSAATHEGIAVTEGGLFVDANDQFLAMIGRPLASLVGRPVQDFVAPEDRKLVQDHIAGGSEEPYQHRARRADGSIFPVEVRARSLPFKGRSVRVSALRDVSDRVAAEERQRRLEGELRQAAEQWRQTFDALDLGIVLADERGRIVRLNRGALQLATGPTFDEAVGLVLADLAGREPWRTMLDLHRQVGESGTSVVAEARDPRAGRAYYLLGSPWARGEGQPPWRVMTFRDVTDLTNVQEQLRQARLLEAMGSLVAGVAHEVRNPLFSISATVDALETTLGDHPDFAGHAKLLRSQVGRLTQLTRDLLDYGRPQALQRAPASLADVVRRAVRACSTLARDREVTVEERLEPGLPILDLDATRMEQAVENLLANAIQHAPAGSVVRILGRVGTEGEQTVLRCSVEDQGPGLPVDGAARVFEPFFTRRKGGTGLGLSIVQRMVEAHGGRVTAENREDGGARFTVHLSVPRAPVGRSRD
jgi:PAS domain S-box-containing protein